MIGPREAWRRFVATLDEREDATALAICRITVGITACSSLARVGWYGVARAGWIDAAHGGMRDLRTSWIAWAGGASPRNVAILMALGMLSTGMLALGAYTRVAAVLAWLTFRILGPLNPSMTDSSDRLIINILFLLMLSGCGNALSIDARFRGKTAKVPAWPRWLLVAQLVTMYETTGLQKVSAGWVPGGPLDALWYILQQSNWQRADMRWLAPYYGATQAMTLVIWIWEQSAPLLAIGVWANETRARPGVLRAIVNGVHLRGLYLAVGLAMHLGITVSMDIQQFFGATMALYACCLTPREWQAIGRRIGIG